MRALNLPGMTIAGKPSDWDDEKDGRCDGLPVLTTNNVRTSVWEFSDLEREQIAKGWNLTLSCVGWQPPVLLTVAPIHEIEPVVEVVESLPRRLLVRLGLRRKSPSQ